MEPPPGRAERTRPCPQCQEPGALRLGAGTEVEVGTVAAALERRPLIACPSDHDRSPDMVVDAGEQAARAQLPRSREKLLRGSRCASCGARLTLPVRRTRRTVTVTGGGVPVHTLHLDVPMTRCGECAWDQVPARSHADVDRAVRAAYLPD